MACFNHKIAANTFATRSVVIAKILLLAGLLSGCAWVTAERVPSNSTERGIRVYGMRPLIVISGSVVTVLPVPNTSEVYALRFGAFLAKHDTTVEIQQGFLVKLQSNQDSTALAVALINLISKAVETGRSVATAFSASTSESRGNAVLIFEPIFGDDGRLIELRQVLDLTSLPTGITPLAPGGQGAPQGGQQGGQTLTPVR